MNARRREQVLVVGGGLGGLSAAAGLAAEGFAVQLFEKNGRLGGKLNTKSVRGYRFDLGPSIFILPHYFRRPFERAGRRMEDYVRFVEVAPQWRGFFEDGLTIDLHRELPTMERELARIGADPAGYRAFVEYSRTLYAFAEEAYLERGADWFWEVLRGKSQREALTGIDWFRRMDQGVRRYIKHEPLAQLLEFFVKYVGSSPYRAPALLNSLAWSQLAHGLWYVPGGMYHYADALGRLLEELGVTVHLDAEVTAIDHVGQRVTGLRLADGRSVPGDLVVCNMEVVPAYRRLLGESGPALRAHEYWLEPAASGLVLDLGVDCRYEQLRHHNFFLSADPRRFLHQIHVEHRLPDDPTLYVVCATRSDDTIAPPGCDVIKVLPHIPYVQDPPFTPAAYEALKQRVYDKLERMGLRDLRRHVVVEDVLVPEDLQRMYFTNRGAIYGAVSDRTRNMAFKAPKRSLLYRNLYFAGGTVNPGPGTPMVVLCGQKVADAVLADLA
jgi:diapolycopene oxygenase